MEASYLAAYLVMRGIHDVVLKRIPEIDIDSFVELMRCVLFSDRTIWCKVATVMGQASRDELSDTQIVSRLRKCFSAGCKRIAIFLSDINSLSEKNATELLHSVRERTFTSNEMIPSSTEPNKPYATVSLPMLSRWAKEPAEISLETVESLAAGGVAAIFKRLEALAKYCLDNSKSIQIDIGGFGVHVSADWERINRDSSRSKKS
jgi:hypothetical protein